MRKKIFILFVLLLFSSYFLYSVDFSVIDGMANHEDKWNDALNILKTYLEQDLDNGDKAEICWRLSMFCQMIGDSKKENTEKRKWFSDGKQYAELGISFDSSSYKSIFWRSANLGKDVLTRSLFDQMGSVDKIWDDYITITDTLGIVDYPEVWHAMGEFYWRNPFKSTSQAVSFLRASIDCRNSKKLDLLSYLILSKILYERNWTAKKRATEINKMHNNWNKSGSVNSVKYSYFEVKNGSSFIPEWASVSLGEISDRQEAEILLLYICMYYEHETDHSYTNIKCYNEANELLKKWK